MKNASHYKLIYVGGALDHTVLPIVLKLYKEYKNDFLFIASKEAPLSRKELGYGSFNNSYDFVYNGFGAKENKTNARKLIYDADVVLFGSVSDRYLLRKRLFSRKISISITERIYKEPRTFLRSIKRIFGTILHYYLFPRKNKYALCIGGYTPNDFDRARLYKGKCLKWAYFTDYSKLSFGELDQQKKDRKINIAWVGRFIDVKQPQMVIKLAKFLHENNVAFEIKMIGYGPLLSDCKNAIEENGLQNKVILTGALPLEKKEGVLNKANIFLFTSTQEEGWGAVVNEALGSACLVVASKESGAPSQLIKDGENGFLFNCFDQTKFNELVLTSINNYRDLDKVRRNGYDLVHTLWNEDVASHRLINVIKELTNENKLPFYDDGPCSEALAII